MAQGSIVASQVGFCCAYLIFIINNVSSLVPSVSPNRVLLMLLLPEVSWELLDHWMYEENMSFVTCIFARCGLVLLPSVNEMLSVDAALTVCCGYHFLCVSLHAQVLLVNIRDLSRLGPFSLMADAANVFAYVNMSQSRMSGVGRHDCIDDVLSVIRRGHGAELSHSLLHLIFKMLSFEEHAGVISSISSIFVDIEDMYLFRSARM